MADATFITKVYEKDGGDTVVVASGGLIDIETGGDLKYNGNSLIDEIAALSGLDSTELGFINGAASGAATASKAAVYDAAGKLYRSSATPAAAGTAITDATVLTAEFNAVTGANGAAGVKLPVAAADETVTIVNTNASNNLLVYPVAASQINALGASNPFTITPGQASTFIGRSATLWYVAAATDTIAGLTASAAELNKLDNATCVVAEINTLTDLPATATMATTPASGTCAVQLTIKNSTSSAIGHAVSGIGYLSTVDGLAIAAATGIAVLTNGALTELVTGKLFHFVSTAAGLLGATVTAGAGSYYITLQMPNGKLVTTAAIVVN